MLAVVGLVVIVIGGVLLYMAKRAADRVHHMKATDTSRVGDLVAMIEEVRGELGGGPSELRQYVELKGTVQCDSPLTAELSDRAAVIVETNVTRDVEELREEKDSEGNVSSRWHKRSETVNSNRLETPFWLDDGSGKLEVRPDGANATLQEVVNRFEAPNAVDAAGAGTLYFGRMRLSYGHLSRTSQQFRVIGYRFRESILPVGARLYALGEISDTGDGLALRKPTQQDKPFLLSTKSEEELVTAAAKQAKWSKIGGLGAIGLGIVLVLVGAVQMLLG